MQGACKSLSEGIWFSQRVACFMPSSTFGEVIAIPLIPHFWCAEKCRFEMSWFKTSCFRAQSL